MLSIKNLLNAWNGLTVHNKIGVLFFTFFIIPCIILLITVGLSELAYKLN